jgi:probable HAF family extracellular repeat protein
MRRHPALLGSVIALAACRDTVDPPRPAFSQAAGPSYQFLALRVPSPQTPRSQAVALNNQNQIVGWVVLNPDETCPCHAFLWQDDSMQDLGTLGGSNSFPADINEAGQIVGWAETPDGATHAVLWEHGAIQDLGTQFERSSLAEHINNAGQVIVESRSNPFFDPAARSFLWDNGIMLELPLHAAAINEPGRIAGWVTTDAGKRRAALWDKGVVTDLGTLGGDESWALALSNSGVVVGAALTATGEQHAFSWKAGEMEDLRLLPGSVSTEAVALNEAGRVTGVAAGPTFRDSRGFFWDHGVLQDIGTLGGPRTLVFDMNRRSMIVGQSMATSSPQTDQAFVWQDDALVNLHAGTGAFSQAAAINDRGVVVGYVAIGTDPGLLRAAMWVPASAASSTAAVAP